MITTLSQYLARYEHDHPEKTGIKAAIEDIAAASIAIKHLLRRGELAGIYGQTQHINIHEEAQQKLDIIANDILIDKLSSTGNWSALASEELPNILPVCKVEQRAQLLCLFDPLDGSGNIDINMPTGTIFSVLPYINGKRPAEECDFLRPGRQQIAAGYTIYGASTTLTLTLGKGVDSFTYDDERKAYVITQSAITIPDAPLYAVNTANYHYWSAAIKRYIDACVAGENGPRGRRYNLRWSGCMAADVHRVLNKGGIFMYPGDSKGANGKLRLMYEANPMAMLIEQAGGRGIAGAGLKLLDIEPENIHQLTPVIIGTATEVDYLQDLLDADEHH